MYIGNQRGYNHMDMTQHFDDSEIPIHIQVIEGMRGREGCIMAHDHDKIELTFQL